MSLNDDNVDEGAKRLPDKSYLMIACNFLSGQAPTINRHLSSWGKAIVTDLRAHGLFGDRKL